MTLGALHFSLEPCSAEDKERWLEVADHPLENVYIVTSKVETPI